MNQTVIYLYSLFKNLGKTITESGYDVDGTVETLNYFASLSYSLNGEQIPVNSKTLAYTIREPLGVCAGKF